MRRSGLLISCAAAGLLTAGAGAPLRADILLSDDATPTVSGVAGDAIAAASAAPAPDEPWVGTSADDVRMGALISDEEWWELPLGGAFMLGSAIGIYEWMHHT